MNFVISFILIVLLVCDVLIMVEAAFYSMCFRFFIFKFTKSFSKWPSMEFVIFCSMANLFFI
ncbi:MAG: hypothetical protein C0595_08410 [Marinilabiliales bacterium]|nr:MAG: hypothetical protein C0595_08410 [Marinilabiliales bacterium]